MTRLQDWYRILESAAGKDRILPMEGMRGYAVLLVFLVHQHTLFRDRLAEGSLLYRISEFGHHIGDSGVDLFFVLSGFLIYGHLTSRGRSVSLFLRRRVRRIYPTFLCVFAIYVLLSYLMPSFSKLPAEAGQKFVYLVENGLLLPGIFSITPLVTVSWSLSFEFFFYLSIPILIAVSGMRKWTRSSRILFFLCLATVHYIAYALKLLPHVRIEAFVAGILLYEVHQTRWVRFRLSRTGEILVILLYGFTFLVPQPAAAFSVYWSILLYLALFGLTLYSFLFNGILTSIFSLKLTRWLGNMSYSFFLLHGLILHGMAYFTSRLGFLGHCNAFLYFALVLLNLILAILASFVLFVFVEKPWSLDAAARRAVGPWIGTQSSGRGRNTCAIR